MIVIRRAVDKHRAYTVIFLKGEEPKWIPTSDYEHQRILEIFKQDRYYEGIENDFKDYHLNHPDMPVTLEQFKKTVGMVQNNFLKSTLDKEKNYPRIDE
ncbi:MAG: hypothetical protein EB127_13760 [Alphaproteobacteria bacterium]|nr:hypothetical protein [Alphaproteobacteria bacterium]